MRLGFKRLHTQVVEIASVLARASFVGAALLYHYGGLRFIVIKFTGKPSNTSNFKEPPSGVLWLMGIYVAAFGIANQQYVRAIDGARILAAAYTETSDAEKNKHCAAMEKYHASVPQVPIKPSLYDPISIVRSLFDDMVWAHDHTLVQARELEGYAWILLNISRSLFLEEERLAGNPRYQTVFSTLDSNDVLRLDQPLTFEAVSLNEHTGRVEIIEEPVTELAMFTFAKNGSELWELCEDKLTAPVPATDRFAIAIKYECTNVILSRACQERRERLHDSLPMLEVDRESEK